MIVVYEWDDGPHSWWEASRDDGFQDDCGHDVPDELWAEYEAALQTMQAIEERFKQYPAVRRQRAGFRPGYVWAPE